MGFLFEHRDNPDHDEHRLTGVGVPGPLHPYRGLGDVVQEAAHHVGDGPFVMSASTRSGGIAGSLLADRLLQGQKAIHHLELAGPPSRRVMFREGNSRGGRPGRGGRRCRFFILYIFTFLFMRWKSNEAKGISNLSIIEHSRVTKAADPRRIRTRKVSISSII